MTAQLSRERLEALANIQSLECMALPASHAESAEMARMLLAGMDSDKKLRDFAASQTTLGADVERALAGSLHELYLGDDTAPPAPVAVPDGMPDAADLEFQIDMLEGFDANSDDKYNTQIICWLKELQRRRAAMLKAGPVTAATVPDGLASSVKCLPVDITDMRFVVCPGCGNKRCPRANDHRNACSGSNEPGQVGSAYPSAPEQEV